MVNDTAVAGVRISAGILITPLILAQFPDNELHHLIMLCLKYFLSTLNSHQSVFGDHAVVFVFPRSAEVPGVPLFSACHVPASSEMPLSCLCWRMGQVFTSELNPGLSVELQWRFDLW